MLSPGKLCHGGGVGGVVAELVQKVEGYLDDRSGGVGFGCSIIWKIPGKDTLKFLEPIPN